MPNVSDVLYAFVLCALFLALARGRRRKSTLPHPPGPTGYPLLGNVLDLPASVPVCETFTLLAGRQGEFLFPPLI